MTKLSVLAGLLAVVWAAEVSAATCERVIQVGSWNIQWLGNAKAGGRKPQKPQAIRRSSKCKATANPIIDHPDWVQRVAVAKGLD
jgi:hypothetical protein